MNPKRVWQAGQIVFDSYCIGPERPPTPEPVPAEEQGEDEGFVEDEKMEVDGVEDGEAGGIAAPQAGANAGDGADGVDGEEDGGLFVVRRANDPSEAMTWRDVDDSADNSQENTPACAYAR